MNAAMISGFFRQLETSTGHRLLVVLEPNRVSMLTHVKLTNGTMIAMAKAAAESPSAPNSRLAIESPM